MKQNYWSILVLCIGISAGVVSVTSRSVQFQSRADEGVYLYYATRIAQEGCQVFPSLFKEYLADAAVRQYFPSPIRLVTLCIDGIAVKLGGASFRSLQWVSLLSFLLLQGVVFFELKQVSGGKVASVAALLLAVSPLSLAMARRGLSDSWVTLVWTCAFIFFLRALTDSRSSVRRWMGVALCFALAFLAKESGIILIWVAGCLIGIRFWVFRKSIERWLFATVSLIPLLLAALAVCWAAGNPQVAWRTLTTTVSSASSNGYALRYGGGPWFRLVLDELLLSPGVTLLYLIWLGYLLRSGIREERLWGWALLPVLLLISSMSMTKNIRYAMILDAPMRLGAAWLICEGSERTGQNRGSLGWLLFLAVLVLADLMVFYQLFVVKGIYDPMSPTLFSARYLPSA